MMQPKPLSPALFVNGRPDVAGAVQAGVNWLRGWTLEHGGVPLIITPGREPEGRVLLAAPQAASITRQTFRTMLSSPWQGGAVLAVWADDKVLSRIDDDYQVTAVCAVLDSLTNAPLWLKARQPTEIGGSGSVLPPVVNLDPIARVALEQLTRHVNLGTGLTHPSDRGYAIETVRALHAGRKKLTPDDAHAWATQHGWRPDGANELRDLVIGVAAGKRYQHRGGTLPASELLAMWEREAANE
ncbi:MAG: hypothetical protein ACYDA0_13240 [Candidatus Dormibacteraceae bacterium]